MVTVIGCHEPLVIDSLVPVGEFRGGRGVTVIVPVKGSGKPGSGDNVYVTVHAEYGSDPWKSELIV